MKNNTDIKELWNRKKAELPDSSELIEKAGKFRRKSLSRLILTNAALLLTSLFIGFIWFYYQPEMITTKIGITLTILAMISYLAVYNLMIPLLTKNHLTDSSAEYLQRLLKIKQKQLFLQNTMLNIYFIVLSAGLFLYMIEYTSRMSHIWGIASYAIVLTWFLINWFYLRPRSIRKQEKSINEMISRAESYRRQLGE
ncbi:MAG: hypothetical protein JSS91_14260 [Bacteroidetes bacterium]|nr:hypothetical protein [Bacteroidota bacterium]